MLTAELVAVTPVRVKPAFSNRARYSGSVRSWPGVWTSMLMSSIFPGGEAIPFGEDLLNDKEAADGAHGAAAIGENG